MIAQTIRRAAAIGTLINHVAHIVFEAPLEVLKISSINRRIYFSKRTDKDARRFPRYSCEHRACVEVQYVSFSHRKQLVRSHEVCIHIVLL